MAANSDTILAAIQTGVDQFAIEHPAQYADIINHFGPGQVIVGVQTALQNDAAYVKLVAETNAEVSIAALAALILPFITKAIALALPALGL
jgi:hypothetical protein